MQIPMAIPAMAILIIGLVLIKKLPSPTGCDDFCILFAMNNSRFKRKFMGAKISYLIQLTFVFISTIVYSQTDEVKYNNLVVTGAEQTGEYINLLKGKKVAIAANPTSQIKGVHLVDTLNSLGIKIVKVFSPEHGFRGVADAGEHLKSYKDKKTGIPIVSLYGKHYKPTSQDLKGVDIVLFDIQDVGARFYTYLSTLHYIMEACAENKLPLLLLDRPNPNGFYVDGPVLDTSCSSFVGIHPIPVIHGCTLGELANMINAEGWLANKVKCKLMVVPLKNWSHNDFYKLPVKPSPNLASVASILFYPSLCLFEGTVISVGRGTLQPFEQYGHPLFPKSDYSFKPVSIEGASKNPPYMNEVCNGRKLDSSDFQKIINERKIQLSYLTDAYKAYPKKEEFFNNYFRNLAGTKLLREQIEKGLGEEEIRKSWEPALSGYKELRKRYLLYADFEK